MEVANYISLYNCASPLWSEYHSPCSNTACVHTIDSKSVSVSILRPIICKEHKL